MLDLGARVLCHYKNINNLQLYRKDKIAAKEGSSLAFLIAKKLGTWKGSKDYRNLQQFKEPIMASLDGWRRKFIQQFWPRWKPNRQERAESLTEKLGEASLVWIVEKTPNFFIKWRPIFLKTQLHLWLCIGSLCKKY